MNLSLAYALFAVVATFVNICTQDLTIRLYSGPYAMVLSVFLGTGTGLVSKYALDKRYIFRFQTRGAMHNASTFMLYALMGVTTTFIFWGFEFWFDYMFQSKAMRYIGGATGLGVGYVTKYSLDKRYVFSQLNPFK